MPRSARILAATAVAAVVALTACTSGGGSPDPRAGHTSGPQTGSSGPATGAGPTAPSSASSTAPAPLPQATAGKPSVVARALEVPWGVAFLPGGDALVSERMSHRIVRVTPEGVTNVAGTVPDVAPDAGEGGLLGIALSPHFASDRLVYAYCTTEIDNRVVRFRYGRDGLGTLTRVFTGIPRAADHDGGRLAFGPDGMLYVTTGDAEQPDRAPTKSYLGGKVLRMTPEGKPAPGNPDPGSVVWTRGHRNPEGLAFGPKGTVFEAELGQDAQDEINRLQAGRDYGWPSVEGDAGGPKAGATAPLLTFATDEASPSGLAYAGGSLWLGALQGHRLYRVPVNTDGSLGAPTSLLDGSYGRLRTVAVAPDGALWVTTSNRDGRGDPRYDDDRIIRIPLS